MALLCCAPARLAIGDGSFSLTAGQDLVPLASLHSVHLAPASWLLDIDRWPGLLTDARFTAGVSVQLL